MTSQPSRSLEDLSPAELAEVEQQAEAERLRRAERATQLELLEATRRINTLLNDLVNYAISESKARADFVKTGVGFKKNIIGDVAIGVVVGLFLFGLITAILFGSSLLSLMVIGAAAR